MLSTIKHYITLYSWDIGDMLRGMIRKITIDVDAEMFQRFKVATVTRGETMSEVLRRAIEEYLQKVEPKQASTPVLEDNE